jgi:DNA polymerase III delta subunit
VAHGGQPAKLASWQIGKLKSQAQAWKPEMLESCFRKLVEIEMQSKSGTMVYELNKALEITFCFYL